jgi:acid phosphatase
MSFRSAGVVRLVLAITASAGIACRGAAVSSGQPNPPPRVATLYDAQRSIDDYIKSGRYDADFAEVVKGAQSWLDERAPRVSRPAIVLDIDETSLSNWPAYRMNGWARVLAGGCDLRQGPCNIRAWQAMGRSAALEPTLTLVQRARQLGVAVFFITGRPPELREATERNLREKGYAWDGVILLPPGAHFASAVEFSVILSMGDQQSDLDGGYAEKTFRLPNPVYFLP